MRIRAALLTALIAIACASGTFADEPPADHRPVISPDGQLVVFMSTRDGGDWELYWIGIDGTGPERPIEPERLTYNEGWDGYAVWDPYMRSFIFDRETSDSRGPWKFDLADVTARPFLRVDGARVSVTGWSGTADKIVMFIERDSARDLYIADPDGSDLEQLTDTPDVNEHDAHFSPDGKLLAFAVNFEGGSALDVMDLATREITRYVTSTQYLYGLDWSPDGTRIAFTDTPNDTPDGNAELYVLDIDASETVRLTNDDNYDHMPVWLRDGRSIMFSSYASGREEIYVLELDDSVIEKFPTGLE